jgi:hypothetical protein
MIIQKDLDWIVASITRINLLLIFSWIKFWFVTVIPKYFYCDTFSDDPLAYLYAMNFPCILLTKHEHIVTRCLKAWRPQYWRLHIRSFPRQRSNVYPATQLVKAFTSQRNLQGRCVLFGSPRAYLRRDRSELVSHCAVRLQAGSIVKFNTILKSKLRGPLFQATVLIFLTPSLSLYSYQKDERAKPGNLLTIDALSPSPQQSVSHSPTTFALLSLSLSS